MKTLEYQLNDENYKELNSYRAMHDKAVRKKLLSLMISICVAVVGILLILLKINIKSILLSAAVCLVVILFFPKLFWNISFKRIDRIVEASKTIYPKMKVKISDEINVDDGKNRMKIRFKDIERMDFTRNNCMVFYKFKDSTNVLIIPNNIFSEDELGNFVTEVEEKIKDAQRGNN